MLHSLDRSTVTDQVAGVHARIRDEFPEIGRVAAALYDRSSDTLATFSHSTDGETPLSRYEAHLSAVPSLQRLAESRETRVIDDLALLAGSPSEHTRRVLEKGYRSSFTVPVFQNEALLGFLFFDAKEPSYFVAERIRRLGVYADLLASVLRESRQPVMVLHASLHMIIALTRFRDAETAGHLYRVSHYSRLIARTLPPSDELDDEFVEFLTLFSPAHDMGKIAIPDAILFKTSRLTPSEVLVMKRHVLAGVNMVDRLVRDLSLEEMPHLAMLRNIVGSHHELMDGTGYPDGLAGDDIPLEARIVGVADVFDALRSRRSYKKGWDVDAALAYLAARRGTHYDPACVDALAASVARAPEPQSLAVH